LFLRSTTENYYTNQQFTAYRLVLRVCELLQRRVSEGFRLRQLVEEDSNSTLTLRLALLWQPHVYVNYIVRCQRSDTTKKQRTKTKTRNGRRNKQEAAAHPHNASANMRGSKLKVEARGAACSSAQPGDLFVQLKVTASPEFLLAFHKVGRAKESDRVKVADLAPFKLHQFLNSIVEVDRLLVHICRLPTLANESTRDGIASLGMPTPVGILPGINENRGVDQRRAVFSLLGAATARWRRWFQVSHMNFVSHFAFDPNTPSGAPQHPIMHACSSWADLASPTRTNHAIFVKYVASDRAGTSSFVAPSSVDGSRSASRERRHNTGHSRVRSSGSIVSISASSDASAATQGITSTCPGSTAFAMVSLNWDTPLVATLHIAFHMVKAASRNALLERLRNSIIHAMALQWDRHQEIKQQVKHSSIGATSPDPLGPEVAAGGVFAMGATSLGPDVPHMYQLISRRNISKLCSVSPGFVDSKLTIFSARHHTSDGGDVTLDDEAGVGVNGVYRPTGSKRTKALLATPLCCHYGIPDVDLKDFFVCRKREFWTPNLSCLRRVISLLVDARAREGYLLVRGPKCMAGTPVESGISWLDTTTTTTTIPTDGTPQPTPQAAAAAAATSAENSAQQHGVHSNKTPAGHRRRVSNMVFGHKPSQSVDSTSSRRASLLLQPDTAEMASCWEVKPGDELHFLRIVEVIGKSDDDLSPKRRTTNPHTVVSCALQYFIRVLSDCTLQVSLVSERSSHLLTLCDSWQQMMGRRTLSWGEAANALNRHTHDVDARIVSTVLSFDGVSSLAKKAIATADMRVETAATAATTSLSIEGKAIVREDSASSPLPSPPAFAGTTTRTTNNHVKHEKPEMVGPNMCKHVRIDAEALENLASHHTLPQNVFKLHGSDKVRRQLIQNMISTLMLLTDVEIPASRPFTSPSSYAQTFNYTAFNNRKSHVAPANCEHVNADYGSRYYVKMVDASTVILVHMHTPIPRSSIETSSSSSSDSMEGIEISESTREHGHEAITITYSAFEYSKLTCEQLIGQQTDAVVNTLLQLHHVHAPVPAMLGSDEIPPPLATSTTPRKTALSTIRQLDSDIYQAHRISLTKQLFSSLECMDVVRCGDPLASKSDGGEHSAPVATLSLDAVVVALDPCVATRETVDASVLVECLFDDECFENAADGLGEQDASTANYSSTEAPHDHTAADSHQKGHVDDTRRDMRMKSKDPTEQQRVFESLTRGFRQELNDCFSPVPAAPHLYHLAPTNAEWTLLAELLLHRGRDMPEADSPVGVRSSTDHVAGDNIPPVSSGLSRTGSTSSNYNRRANGGKVKGVPDSHTQSSATLLLQAKDEKMKKEEESLRNESFEFDDNWFVVKREPTFSLQTSEAVGSLLRSAVLEKRLATNPDMHKLTATRCTSPSSTERPKGFPPLFFTAQVVQFDKKRRRGRRSVGAREESYPIVLCESVIDGDLGEAVRAWCLKV
jgi:hypothetical protein